jgi:hypothetical protein
VETITAEYLAGIIDSRQLLNAAKSRGEYGPEFAAAALASTEATLGRGAWGREVADHLRGGRDFWRGQVSRF